MLNDCMTRDAQIAAERANKRYVIELLAIALRADPGSDVLDVTYEEVGPYEERVHIYYKSGAHAAINVNCNSNGANIREVVAEVYGSGATGRLYI